MGKNLSARLVAILLVIAASDVSLSFGETYRWTDAKGTTHFSDTPPAHRVGKQLLVQRDDTKLNPSVPLKKESKTAPTGNKQRSEQQTWKPDAACMEEIRAFDKKLSNDERVKSCMASVQDKSKQRYSPECLRQLESKSYNFTAACQAEFEAVGQSIVTELQQCTQIDTLIKSNISSGCREQSERYQKQIARCGEITRNIVGICGQNSTCFKEHQAELDSCR